MILKELGFVPDKELVNPLPWRPVSYTSYCLLFYAAHEADSPFTMCSP